MREREEYLMSENSELREQKAAAEKALESAEEALQSAGQRERDLSAR